MAKTILNFHFDYLTPSQYLNCIKKVPITYTHSHINQGDKGETKSTPLMSWANTQPDWILRAKETNHLDRQINIITGVISSSKCQYNCLRSSYLTCCIAYVYEVATIHFDPTWLVDFEATLELLKLPQDSCKVFLLQSSWHLLLNLGLCHLVSSFVSL